jgi:hypothetical protein
VVREINNFGEPVDYAEVSFILISGPNEGSSFKRNLPDLGVGAGE